MLITKRFHLVVGIAILLVSLLANTTTGRTGTQEIGGAGGVGDRAYQGATPAATAEPTEKVSDFPAQADQIAQGPHKAVKSNDGRLTLMIPDGALPAGVSETSIKITNIPPNSVPVTVAGGQPTLAYRFEPDGLKFSTPAIVVLTINPPAGGNQPMLWTVSGDTVEAINTIWYSTDPKTRRLTITAPLAHFSDLISSKGLFRVDLRTIADHTQNNPFNAEATVSREEPSPIENWTLNGYWAGLGPLAPRSASNTPPTTALSTRDFSVRQQFTCNGLSDFARVTYTANIDFSLNVEVKKQIKTFRLGQTLSVTRNFMCVRLVKTLSVTFGNFTSTYKITAADPDLDKLTYAWTNSNSCGDFVVTSDSSVAKWVHPHTSDPGACPEEGTHHPAQVTVVVSDGHGATETVTYTAGSSIGLCKFELTGTEVEGPCSITP
jgi:hypothetical protein